MTYQFNRTFPGLTRNAGKPYFCPDLGTLDPTLGHNFFFFGSFSSTRCETLSQAASL